MLILTVLEVPERVEIGGLLTGQELADDVTEQRVVLRVDQTQFQFFRGNVFDYHSDAVCEQV